MLLDLLIEVLLGSSDLSGVGREVSSNKSGSALEPTNKLQHFFLLSNNLNNYYN